MTVSTTEPVAVDWLPPFGVKSTYTVTSIKRFLVDTAVSDTSLSLLRKLNGVLQKTTPSEPASEEEMK
jgi:hypothetical protein